MTTLLTALLIVLSTTVTLRVLAVEQRIGPLARLRFVIPGEFLAFVFPWMAFSLLNSSGRTWFFLVLGIFLGARTPIAYASPLLREAFTELFKGHPHDLVVWAVIMATFTTCLFGVALAAFSFWGWVTVASGGAHSTIVTPTQADLYFIWQLVNAIPVLELPGALHWARDISDPGVALGVMTVAFKVMVAVPTVAILAQWWRQRRLESTMRQTEGILSNLSSTDRSKSA